ncbi:MAG: tRNA preQ1(34) S-adenosylmethionine ribosyltransferase-isomerase QueA [Gemmatimonadales bacterium]
MRTDDFDYPLPPELIAQVPSPARGDSRLLLVDHERKALADRRFSELAELIPPGDLLVLNSTRVLSARLLGRRPSGAPAEVLLLHPATDDTWIAMGSPGSALRVGKRIALGEGVEVETVEVLEGPNRRVRVIGTSVEEAMRRFGQLPLPPYIERRPTALDRERYQTVFAERAASVAAPTAGLHFTTEALGRIGERGVGIARLELEVGPGTFRPVDVEDPATHPMHPERFEIPERAARQIAETRERGGAVWAVGTTVVRALESAALPEGRVRAGRDETRLLILPGYRFRVVDRLLTNFHLPRSTLLMLVSAFGGSELIRAAYRHAVGERYRFYSYGDAMLIR